MEMNELFYKNVYLKEFEADVISCSKSKKGYDVILSDTAFYPEGGGQSYDQGMIGDANVINVQRVNDSDTIVHTVDKEVQGHVVCKIDWERRFDHMQNHTGEHIVSGLIHKYYGGENVGFHMTEEKIQADYDVALTHEDIEKIEYLANEVIHQNLPIKITYPSDEELEKMEFRSKKELSGKVRIVTIDDVDICACCGTHVNTTAEVNMIKIIGSEKHKDGTRIEVLCGNRAFKDYQMKHTQNTALYQLFSVKPDQVEATVKKLNESYQKVQKQLYEESKNYLNERKDKIQKDAKVLDILHVDIPNELVLAYAKDLLVTREEIVVLIPKGNDLWQFIAISNTEDLHPLLNVIKEKFNGKGGGKNTFIQGSFTARKEELENILSNAL